MFPDAALDRFAARIRALPERRRALTWRLIRIGLALVAGAGTALPIRRSACFRAFWATRPCCIWWTTPTPNGRCARRSGADGWRV